MVLRGSITQRLIAAVYASYVTVARHSRKHFAFRLLVQLCRAGSDTRRFSLKCFPHQFSTHVAVILRTPVRHTSVDVTDARWPDLVRWQSVGATGHR